MPYAIGHWLYAMLVYSLGLLNKSDKISDVGEKKINCTPILIDYGIMWKADNIVIVPASVG